MSHAYPLVSIIIPIYNVQEYLADCLQSVAQQTYRNLEILCVIDGSQDDSENIARSFADTHSHCQIIVQANQGLSAARNTGLQAAAGDWVFFLDADDWLAENAVQQLVQAAQQTGKAVISGAVMEHWEETGIIKPYKKPQKRPVGAINLHQQNFFALETMAWNKLYRRDLVVQYPFTPGLVHEDLDFYWRFFSQYPDVYAIPGTVIHYRRRSGTLSQQKSHDEHYQHNYIRILDNAFLATQTHKQLRYQVLRQSLKYLKYLKEKNAPYAQYERHIRERYGIKDTKGFRFLLTVKRALGISTLPHTPQSARARDK